MKLKAQAQKHHNLEPKINLKLDQKPVFSGSHHKSLINQIMNKV